MDIGIETTLMQHNKIDPEVTSKKTKYIKIIPQTLSSSLPKAPLLIPVLNSQMVKPVMNPVNTLIVDNKGRIIKNSASVKPGGTNVLISQTKTSGVRTTPMIISSDANILRNQIKASNSQTPIIIPATASILKASIKTPNLSSSSVANINPQLKVVNSKPVLIPVLSHPQFQDIRKPIKHPEESSFAVTNLSTLSSNLILKNSDSEPNNCENFNVDERISESYVPRAAFELSENLTSNIFNKNHVKKIKSERFEKMDKLLLKQLKLNNALRKRLHLMSNRIQQLLREQNDNCKDFLKDVFTENQIRVLELRHTNPKSVSAWSHKTLIKAIKLKKECGARGYEELLKQNMPLPSIRTICRWCNLNNIPIP